MAENFFGSTNTGRLRDNNEDTFIAERLDNGQILACVIDGVGGYEGGEIAAAIARETIWESLQQYSGDSIAALKDSILKANRNIYNEKLKGRGSSHMACVLTLALADIENNQFFYAHVGDTRLYLLRDGSLVKVTKDHSFVGFLEDTGRISEKEAMAHPKRNEINKALGFDAQIELREDYIETGSSPFLPGDRLLLCSDGLTDMVDNEQMTAILVSQKTLRQKGEALIEAANNAGGKDNITVVLVHNNKKQQKQEVTRPAAAKKNNHTEGSSARIPETKTEPGSSAARKKGRGLIGFLVLLCLLLLALSYWLWTRNQALTKSAAPPVVPRSLNEAEKKLHDSLGLAPSAILLSESVFGRTITLSDTLFIRQDSLHINGHGIILQGDSAYTGPALLATANNRYLFLENIIFRNFQTAVMLQGRGIHLKNVQFENCPTPVLRHLFLPSGQSLSGEVRDTFIHNSDSLPK